MKGSPTTRNSYGAVRIKVEKEGRPVGFVTVSTDYVGPVEGREGFFSVSGAYHELTPADRPHVKLACEAAVAQMKSALELGLQSAIAKIDEIIPETVELNLRERISKNA